jgi:hypothetical protein
MSAAVLWLYIFLRTLRETRQEMLALFFLQLRNNIHVEFLGFLGECIGPDIELGYQFDEGIDAAFDLKKFIKHHYFFRFEYAIAALKGAPFVAKNITSLLGDAFQFIKGRLRVLHELKNTRNEGQGYP